METRTLRFNKTVAGTYEVRPAVRDTYGYFEGEVAQVPVELATSLVNSGASIAEPVNPPRNAEVERATREPRSEHAVALERRRRA